MLLLKILGAVLLGIAGFSLGAEKAGRIRANSRFWAELGQMLGQVQDSIRYRALELPLLMEELHNADYPHLSLGSCTRLSDFQFPDDIPSGDAAPFLSLFAQIGQVTAEELCGQVDYYIALCRQNSAKQEKEYAAAARLFPQAGMCTGLMAALLLF